MYLRNFLSVPPPSRPFYYHAAGLPRNTSLSLPTGLALLGAQPPETFSSSPSKASPEVSGELGAPGDVDPSKREPTHTDSHTYEEYSFPSVSEKFRHSRFRT